MHGDAQKPPDLCQGLDVFRDVGESLKCVSYLRFWASSKICVGEDGFCSGGLGD